MKTAPEICARRVYDARKADIWSLGVLMFAMLCGYFPFQGQTTQELAVKIQKGVFRIPEFVTPGTRHTTAFKTIQPLFCDSSPDSIFVFVFAFVLHRCCGSAAQNDGGGCCSADGHHGRHFASMDQLARP